LVGWAAHAMQEIEQQFMCNVSRLGDYANAKIITRPSVAILPTCCCRLVFIYSFLAPAT